VNNESANLIPIAVMARLVGVTARWLRAEVAAGHIPALVAEDRVLVNPDVVMKVLVRRASGPETNGDAAGPDADPAGGEA